MHGKEPQRLSYPNRVVRRMSVRRDNSLNRPKATLKLTSLIGAVARITSLAFSVRVFLLQALCFPASRAGSCRHRHTFGFRREVKSLMFSSLWVEAG
jgi:hypothetical protein